jgi:hypothetical protein
MKRIATALAGAALLVTLTAPAEAAVASRSGTVFRSTDRQPPECYGQRPSAGREISNECWQRSRNVR